MPPPERPKAPISLFYSYSQKDEKLRDKLETHLGLLKAEGVIRDWHDRRIDTGTEWDGAISKKLEDAELILLLVSADFLASRYCRDVEIARAMERHEAGTARVIPVILRPVDGWQSALFGKLQALPKHGKPVTDWRNGDQAFADVARGIREAAKSLASPALGSFIRQLPPTDRSAGWEDRNARRIELARKKNREGLTPAELAEFGQLQTGYFDYLGAKHPRTLPDESRLAQLEARLNADEKPREDR